MTRPSIQSFGKRTRAAGFTLIEIVFVLIILAIGIAYAVSQGASTSTASRATNLAQSVSYLNANVSGLFRPDFANMTSCTPVAQNSGFKGTTFTVDAAGVVTWGDSPTSALTCAPANLFATNDGYTLAFAGMTDEECTQFTTKVDNLSWIISVDGTTVKALRATLNPATLGAQCSAAAAADNHTVTITLARSAPGK